MKHALSAALIVALSVITSGAAPAPEWLRYPALSPDGKTIVFEFKGDLWRVASSGGAAVPLTTNEAHDYLPVWSHDGSKIAFASDRFGNFDVFVMPAEGGEPTRLTHHSAPESPYAFSADDTAVLFGASRQDAAANRQYPAASQPELYRVPVTGGRVQQVLTTPAEEVKTSKDGRWMLYQDKKGGENVWRKHHTSSITRDIWLYDAQSGTHKKLTTSNAEDRTPNFVDGDKSFAYLSEQSGTFNVHKMSVAGGPSQQLTQFKGAPVRFLTVANNGAMAFSQDGQLFTLGAGGGTPKKVAVTIAADAREGSRVVPITGGAREMAVSPSGKEVAFIARGDVFVTSVEGATTKQITKTPEIEAAVSFSPDGKALIYASERGNMWQIVEARRAREDEPYFYASTVIRETPIVVNAHENDQPSYSPDGTELAFVEDRNTLKILNLATKQVRTLLTINEIFASAENRQYFQWSPDGKWMLFDYSVPGVAPGEVGLIKTDGTGKVINLTGSGFNDSGARWILGGKGMTWLSNRDGLKAVAQSGGAQVDVYGMFFTVDGWDRYRLTKDEFALVKEAEDKREKDAAAKKDATKPEPLALDLDGADARKTRFTIHSSSLGDAVVSKDGESLYYLARFEKGMNLWTTNLRTKETKQLLALNAAGGSLEWDKEQKTLFLLADGGISKIDPAGGKRDAISISGEMRVDPAAERAAAFEHVWRRTKNTFYDGSYHGVNWFAQKEMYGKYLAGIGNNFDFAEMLAEMLGDLNISHSGASYTGGGGPNADATASLGIFYDQAYAGVGVKVVEVLKDGPLAKAGMNVTPGTIIESIDGDTIAADKDLSQFLNRKAGKKTLLGLRSGATTREIVVAPIAAADENRLLYARWVKRNQDEVDTLSKGALGYVHLPGMNDGAYRTTVEDVLGKYVNRKGIVVDTRFNGGGDLVADLAMFLSGKQFFDYTTATRSNGFEPNFRWTKPSISIGGEANYSDGHCYVYVYQALGIGKLVGQPTPGTCTFAGWESLTDLNIRWGVPGVGVKNDNSKFLENMQTTPDVLVMNEYGVVSKGKDQQLEAAVAELLKAIR